MIQGRGSIVLQSAFPGAPFLFQVKGLHSQKLSKACGSSSKKNGGILERRRQDGTAADPVIGQFGLNHGDEIRQISGEGTVNDDNIGNRIWLQYY